MWIIFKKTKSAVVICLVASLCFILFAPAASAEEIFDPRDLRLISADDTPWGEGRGNAYSAPSANVLLETIWIVTDIIISGQPQEADVQSDKANRRNNQDTDENETLRKVE